MNPNMVQRPLRAACSPVPRRLEKTPSRAALSLTGQRALFISRFRLR